MYEKILAYFEYSGTLMQQIPDYLVIKNFKDASENTLNTNDFILVVQGSDSSSATVAQQGVSNDEFHFIVSAF